MKIIKSQACLTVLVITHLLVLTTLYAQVESSMDTLVYFADQNVDLGGLAFTGIDSLGVYFTLDNDIEQYDLLEFQLLLSPYIYVAGDSTFSGRLDVHSNKRSQRPGSVLQSIYFSAQGSEDIYPNWKIINLRDSTATKQLENDFWLLGLDLAATVISETNSGHTFFHNSFGGWDSIRYDFAVKAIIQQNRPTSVGNESTEVVSTDNSLYRNYPNPFNQETTIRFFLDEPTPVTIDIFDLSGRLVRTLVHDRVLQGQQKVVWDGKDSRGRDIGSGVYFYRFRLGHQNITRKMLLIQ